MCHSELVSESREAVEGVVSVPSPLDSCFRRNDDKVFCHPELVSESQEETDAEMSSA